MKPLNLTQFGDAPLIDLHDTYAFVVTRVRNAWNGTISTRYQRKVGLQINLERAKAAAEGWRERGSKFRIDRVPAIAVLTEEAVAVMVEFHTAASFKTWAPRDRSTLKLGTSLREVVTSLGTLGRHSAPRPSSDSFVTGVLTKGDAHYPAGFGLSEPDALESFSQGSDYYLGWRKTTPQRAYEYSGVNRIMDVFTQMNPNIIEIRHQRNAERALEDRRATEAASRPNLRIVE